MRDKTIYFDKEEYERKHPYVLVSGDDNPSVESFKTRYAAEKYWLGNYNGSHHYMIFTRKRYNRIVERLKMKPLP